MSDNPPERNRNILISVNKLNKTFATKSGPVDVLFDNSFTVHENSFAIIFGPSGSGKTTLLNVLSALEPPTSGTVEIANQDIYRLNADQRAHFRAQTIGIVHQTDYWIKSLDVLENVALPLYLTGDNKAHALKQAQHSLEEVGMAEFSRTQPTVLSGGQQQKVSMARALVANPTLILADEPTGNLDSKNGQMIMDLLLKCQRELKQTIILVTHNIEYLPLSDTQLYIMDGRITETKRGQKMPEEILKSLTTQISELTAMEKEK
ncbi:MAG TPA: ABC transporter ATP-binding protein [Patescibacteria group bacterium]|jgi:ABC-type lipoprotein export system ATPase subunit|nr:ABC transporter ATP-binding protein [Patescibacteria group bacterium]